ncbi:VOC family protein, partial [Escherichia coli]
MSKQLYPCIWFDGNAQVAANLYTTLFANSKINVDNG